MKKAFVIIGFAITMATGFTSCRDENANKETLVREVRVEKEVIPAPTPPKKEPEGVLERTAKKVDNEVNKEIDKKINEIGDDN